MAEHSKEARITFNERVGKWARNTLKGDEGSIMWLIEKGIEGIRYAANVMGDFWSMTEGDTRRTREETQKRREANERGFVIRSDEETDRQRSTGRSRTRVEE